MNGGGGRLGRALAHGRLSEKPLFGSRRGLVGRRVYFEATCVPGEFPGFGLLVVGLTGPEVSVEVAPQNDHGDPSCSGVM